MSAAILAGSTGGGSGGSSGPKPPASILLLEADSILGVANNGSVATWPDTSGNADNNVQTTPLNQPTFLTSGGPNGKPAVSFDGANSWMSFTTNILGAAIEVCMAVIKPSGAGSNRTLVSGPGVAGAYDYRINSANKQELLKAATASIGTSITSIPTTSWSLVECKYDGTTVSFTLNGAFDGSATNAQTFTNMTAELGINIGSELFSGAIAALAMVTALNQLAMRTYLNAKYAIF